MSMNNETYPFLAKALIFFAFVIPLFILGYVLYINYLPFGYEKSYELTLDEKGLITPSSNDIYVVDNNGKRLLSLPEGINGQINVIIEPKVALKNASVDVKIEGESVFIGMPLALNLPGIGWDYSWDFTQRIPEGFEGAAEYKEDGQCTYFDSADRQTLFLPNSENLFESDPMSIYARWKPSEQSKILGDRQQIIGHYNWEIYQGKDSVRFQIGRMNDKEGSFYSVSYPITVDFFDNEHELLAVYSPEQAEGKGHIELWVDGEFAGRTSIADDVIFEDYNADRPLNLGWSSHNYRTQPYFDGCIYETGILNSAIEENIKTGTLYFDNSEIKIPIKGYGSITSIKLDVRQ